MISKTFMFLPCFIPSYFSGGQNSEMVMTQKKEWQQIVWNNKDIRINNKPVFYGTLFESGIIYVKDLLFDKDTRNSFETISSKISKTNFLTWAGLRHSVPSYLKTRKSASSDISLLMMIDNKDFDVLKKKSKDYYTLIKITKTKLPNNSPYLRKTFNLSEDQLKKVFLLPHKVSFESYIKAFQYKILNSILFTNAKLFKIGYISDDKCSFCKSEPETLHHLFFYCSFVRPFWKDFECFFYLLTKEFVHLTLQDVMIGIIYANCPLLNYLLLVAKLYIWDCRRNLTSPIIDAFKLKAKVKYETEKLICVKTNNIDKFNKKWDLCMGLYFNS